MIMRDTYTVLSIPHVLLSKLVMFFLLPQITLSCSSLSTVVLAIERYIAVCWPFLLYRQAKADPSPHRPIMPDQFIDANVNNIAPSQP